MKRTVSVFLALVFALTLFALPSGAAFNDVPEDRELEIAALEMLSVLTGFPDGTFRPENLLTRAQFCKMIVETMGRGGRISLYSAYTVYPDVLSTHWAAAYINYSVKELKLVLGFADGTFKPDRQVTLAEGVTILMRALGYTDADVGASWPSGYLSKAAEAGLLNGVQLEPSAPLSRLNGARLFYNLLSANIKDGGKFLGTVSAGEQQSVVILDNNATASDGAKGAVELYNGGVVTTLKASRPMPEIFAGKRGSVFLDANGDILTFIPSGGKTESIILSEVTSTGVTSEDGKKYKFEDDTIVFIEGEPEKFIDCWIDLKAGRNMDIAYTPAGVVDYLVLGLSASGDAFVLTAVPSSQRELEARLGAAEGMRILKNGAESKVSDLRKLDVAAFKAQTNTLIVTDFKLSGSLEYATPNIREPRTVRVLGNEFEVMEGARSFFSSLRLGQNATLLMSSDGRVAGAVPQDDVRATPIGLCTGSKVEFINGPAISVPEGEYTGRFVRVLTEGMGKVRLSPVTKYNEAPGSYDVLKGTIGTREVPKSALHYEQIGNGGYAGTISKSNILKDKIPAEDIIHVEYDSTGRVLAVILNDVTGDLYEYGRLHFEEGEDIEPLSGAKVSYNILWVVNSEGAGEKLIDRNQTAVSPTQYVGLAGNYNGTFAGVTGLKAYTGIKRDAFVNAETVVIDGIETQIAENVHVYIESVGGYITGKTPAERVNEARAGGGLFDLYLNKAPAEGGKVRIIVVKP